MSETTRPVYDDADMVVDVPLTPGGLLDIRKNLSLDFTHQPPVKETKPDLLPGQEHMKVYLRVRPFMEHELEKNENQNTIHQDTEHTLTVHAPKDSVTFKNTAHGCAKQTHNFTFSKIFNDNVQQKGFFEETMLGTVKEFVDGQNCLMFTYGVTGSGKTYTILGKPNDSGILPRSLDVVFNSIEGKQWASMSLKPHMFCDVTALSETQQEIEQKVKDKVFRLSTEEDVDMTTMMGDELSDVSRSTVNMTTGSLPSLTRESTADSLTATGDNTQVQIEQLFEEAKHRDREQAAIDVEAQGQIRFSIWVSFAEIYNEYIYDLLDPIPKKKTARRAILKLASDKTGAPYIKGLKWIHVTTADEAYKVLTIGQRNLQTACTKLNQNSSRSHCIFTMKLLRVVDKENPKVARVSMLSFCDLAGSERYSKTQSTGDRLREAGSINRSLLTLGQCIEILRYNQTHKGNQRIVPFRESKLTRLFQNFFSGKGRASMVVNINQNASMFDETLHVLKFSAIAKQVTSVQKEEKKPKKMMSLSMGPDGRASVAWATPGSMQRWIEEEDEDEKLQTVEEEEEESLYEEDSHVNQKLLDMNEKLRDQLKEAHMKMAMMELDIREEVCNEMASQLVKIEQDYSERMEEQRYQAEERADQKLKLYMASIKKSRKRARVDRFQDDDDEYVSTVVLHQEKVKVQELEREKKSLQEQLTKTRFELSAAKQQIEKGITFEKSVTLNDSSDITNNELMENMAQQLEDSKSKLAQQEEQIIQLNDMLTEAGDMFEMKEIEIEKLKAVIHDDERRIESLNETMEDLKRVAVDSKQAMEEAEVKMKAQDDTIRRLEAELSERDNQVWKLEKACSANDVQIDELKGMIDVLEGKCEELRSQIEIEKCDYEFANAKSLDSEVQVSDTLRKYEAERLKHAEATRRIRELEARLEKPEGALSITIMESKREDLENELFQEREDRSHVEEKMRKMEQKIDELEAALATPRAPGATGAEVDVMIEKLRCELSGAKGQIDVADSMITELSQKVKELEGALEEAELELSMTRDEKSYSERKISNVHVPLAEKEALSQEPDDRDVLISRMKLLEEELQESQNVCEKNAVELNELKAKLSLVEEDVRQVNTEKAILLTKLEMFEEDFEKCDERLVIEMKRSAELQTSLERLKAELDAANEKIAREVNFTGRLADLEKELEDSAGEVVELEKELNIERDNVKRLEQDLKALQAEVEGLRRANKDLEKANETIAVLRKELKDANEKATSIETELDKASSQSCKVKELESELEGFRADTRKVERMEVQLGEIRVQAERSEHLEEELQSVKQQKKKMEDELDAARRQLQTFEKTKEELRSALSELMRLEDEMESVQAELKDVKRELKLSVETAGHLEQTLADVRKEKEVMLADAHLQAIEVGERESTIVELRRRIAELEISLEETDEELSQQSMSKERAEEQRALMEARLKKSQSRLEKAEMTVVDVIKHREKAEENVGNLKEKVSALTDECNELRGQLSEATALEQKVQDLEAEVEKQRSQLGAEIGDKSSEVEGLQKKVRELEATVNEQTAVREELEANANEQTTLRVELEASVNEQTTLREELEANVTELTMQREKLEASVKELTILNRNLEEKVHELEANVEQQVTLKAVVAEKVSELEASVEEQNALKAEAELALADLRQTLEEQMSLQSELEQKLTEKVAEVDGCQARIGDLEASLAKGKSRLQDLESTIMDLEAKLDGQKIDKAVMTEALQSQIEELEAQIKNLEGRQASRTVEVSDLTEGLNAKSAEVEVLMQKVHELELSRRELETVRQALQSSQSVLEEKVTELHCEVDMERSRRQQAERQVEALTAKMAALESDLETTEGHEEDVSRALETIAALKQDLIKANSYITEQNSRLDSLEIKFNSRENDFAKKDASLQEMSEKLQHEDQLVRRVKKLEERLTAADKATAAFQTDIETLHELAAEQDAERSDQVKAYEELEAEKEQLEIQLEKMSKEKLKLMVVKAPEIETLKQLLSDKEEEVVELQKRLDSFVMTPRQTRRGRSSKAPKSLTASTEENFLLELKKLSDELEKEQGRRKVEQEKHEKDMSAKDLIILDLKATNQQLLSMMPVTPAKANVKVKKEGIENIDPVDLSTLDVPMGSFSGQVSLPSPEPVKRKTRGRPRKKQSNEGASSVEPTPSQSGRKTRPRKPLSSTKRGSTSSSVSPNLSSLDFQSYPVMQKRKRRLYRDMDPLLEGCSPLKMTSQDQRLLSSSCHCDCHREMLASPCQRRCCKRCTKKEEEPTRSSRQLRSVTPRH